MVMLLLPASHISGAPGVRTDSSFVTVRQFDAKRLQGYKADPDFVYNEEGGSVSPSWWQRFWIWVWSLFRGLQHSVFSTSNTFWNTIILLLAAGAVILLIVKMRGVDLSLLLSGKAKRVEVPYQESLENIHEISFDEEIDRSVRAGDFRFAVRLMYLKTLKRLNDAGRIKWEADKTNSDYIRELKQQEQRQQFSVLTREFEYVWYGSFPVDAAAFEKIRTSFTGFNKGAGR
ncbi:DUF4129 domain-containing protein [Arcticibacter sp. MXS-1]|uniref:DUF4129 domain-containing protein n=1 Tax=Arcticibacter sp. MXS-1 TaxID=3341726 RepID=UPI0035A84676